MKAVILAGGMGTRLQRVTHGALPKPMAELGGKPVLEHIVALLAGNGFTDICCTLACMPEVIRRHFGDGSAFGVRMEYRVENKPLGTAAIDHAVSAFGQNPAQFFCLCDIFRINLCAGSTVYANLHRLTSCLSYLMRIWT